MDEIRKMYKDSIGELMKNTMTEEEIDAIVNGLTEKAKTIKKGDNVVHLGYYKGPVTEIDLAFYEEQLSTVGLELSSYDSSGTFQNSIQDLINHFTIVISPVLLDNILFGVAGNAVWDVIKSIAKSVKGKIKGQKLNFLSGKDISEKEITFGITASFGPDRKYDFRIDANNSDATFLQSVDKVLDFLKEHRMHTTRTGHQFGRYNATTDQWETYDIYEEITRIHSQQKDL